MRISELSTTAGVPVPTLKYYLREGLLHPGTPVARTQAQYDDTHVARIRLIRALTGIGGLDIATTRRVLETIDNPTVDRLGILGAAQRSLLGAEHVPAPPPSCATEPDEAGPSRARRFVTERGWRVHLGDPLLDRLDTAWEACDAADLGLDEERMDAYADAIDHIARIDVASTPQAPAEALRQVVLGTVLVDPVLATLRRLAQQHVAVSQLADPRADLTGPEQCPDG